uniref:Uncharacterized protein n=1 Tax=Avena sativa TaxID=4498 RepID=A0ACD6AM01_AVESA
MEKTSCGAGDEEEVTWLQAWGLVTNFAVSLTLKAAIELGLLDALSNAAGPGRGLTADQLSAHLPAVDKAEAAASVDRILRLLASFDIVRCSTDAGHDGSQTVRQYTAAPVCRWLTRDNGGASLAPLAMFTTDQDYMSTWHHLAAAAGGGGPASFERAHGVPMFEYMSQNPRLRGLFDQAMVQMSSMVTSKLLDRYHGFDGISVLVDIGGRTGSTLQMITSRHQHISGINFDLPHVISEAPPVPAVVRAASASASLVAATQDLERHGNAAAVLGGVVARRRQCWSAWRRGRSSAGRHDGAVTAVALALRGRRKRGRTVSGTSKTRFMQEYNI